MGHAPWSEMTWNPGQAWGIWSPWRSSCDALPFLVPWKRHYLPQQVLGRCSGVVGVKEPSGSPGTSPGREPGVLTLGSWLLLRPGHGTPRWGQRFFSEESVKVGERREPGSRRGRAKASHPPQAAAVALPTLRADLISPAEPRGVNQCWAEQTQVEESRIEPPRVSEDLGQLREPLEASSRWPERTGHFPKCVLGARAQAPTLGPTVPCRGGCRRQPGKAHYLVWEELAYCQVLPTFDPIPVSLKERQTGEGVAGVPGAEVQPLSP